MTTPVPLQEVLDAAAPAVIADAFRCPDERPLIVIEPGTYVRQQYIGSSNVAAILGLSPTMGGRTFTAYDVYLAKTSAVAEEMDPETKLFLERRKRWEPVVVQMLREELGAEVVNVNVQYRDRDVPFFAAEIDFEWVDEHGEVQNGEIKTVHSRTFGARYGWGEPGTGDIPVHYEAQVQYGLGITGRRRTAVAAMVGLDDMVFYNVERNDEDLAVMRRACIDFWFKNVLAKVAPEAQTIQDLEKMFRRPELGKTATATDEVGSKALQLRAIWSQMEALEMQASVFEFDLKKAMGDAEALIVDGDRLLTWKEQNWSRLDQESLKAKEPKIHRQYVLSGKHRIFKSLKSWNPTQP